MKLSIVMPVYNEAATTEEIIKRVLAERHDKELVIVDDASTDGTGEILRRLAQENPEQIKLVAHEHNHGKGAAVRTGFAQITGEVVIIQDADLEYDPQDYEKLLEPIQQGWADVVYGSRFLGKRQGGFFCHYAANKFLTFITNLLYNARLTDMETCYKALRSDIARDLTLRSNSFDIEAEITAKIRKRGIYIHEVPIKYFGRSYHQGKKIGWRDGLQAIWTLVKYRFVD